MRDVPEPVRSGDGGKEHAKKFAERHAYRGDGAGLDDEKERPAEQESPQRAERLAQVNVLAAGFGHHGGEFAVAERANDGEHARDDPGAQIEGRRVGVAGDVGVDQEDAGADHGSDHDSSRAEQAKRRDQLWSVGL